MLAQELAYQWLGSWVTPLWWSDAHLNKALAGFLAASAALEVIFYESLFCSLLTKFAPVTGVV